MTLDEIRDQLNTFQAELLDRLCPETPKHGLWHYTTADGLRGILASKRIWASDVRCLNDPSEPTHGAEVALRILDGRTDPVSRSIVKALRQDSTLGLGTDWFRYAACFCGTPDLLSQWRGYTRRGDAYAIHFESAAFPQHGTDYEVSKLLYEPAQKEQAINETIQHDLELLESNGGPAVAPELAGEFGVDLAALSLTFKHDGFREEDEWRLTVLPPKAANCYRTTYGKIVPYLEVPFDPRGVTKVLVGPEGTPLDIQFVKAFLANLKYDHMLVEGSRIPFR